MITPYARITLLGSLALAGVLMTAARAGAQARISGRVLDPQDNPVAGIEVLLHAITESSGEEVDRDTSRADGRFTVNVRATDQDAVYFVAVMHESQLYIGDLLRAPFQLNEDYVVRVGINPVDLSPGAPDAPAVPPAAGPERTAGVVVIIVSALVIVTVIGVLLRRRAPARRRWLVELARLEEDMAASPEPDEALLARRAELRARLLQRTSG